MAEQEHRTIPWMDVLSLAFIGGLALLQPIEEPHKLGILLAIGVVQILEQRLLAWVPSRGRSYTVVLKILLGTLLLEHTGTAYGINSSYFPIYFLPVITAAMYFDVWGTLLWTATTSLVYCSLLIPALEEFELTAGALSELAIRCLFFFLAGVVVNRVVSENRHQSLRYRLLAEELAETNRRLAQAQEEARRSERLAALGQLSAGLAHELRNPLAVIKGSAETLARKLPPGDQLSVELAGYISSEVYRLNAIVTRFLDFARPSKLQRHPEQIPELLDRALKASRDRWPDAPVEVERHYAPSLPAANVDPDLSEQAFTNLTLNAYEAMSGEAGKLRVSATAATSNGTPGVEVCVEDTGPGVPPELRQQIFNPFFTTKQSGVGLGLSLVSKIVDDHHGWIRVESREEKGARFRIFLPLE